MCSHWKKSLLFLLLVSCTSKAPLPPDLGENIPPKDQESTLPLIRVAVPTPLWGIANLGGAKYKAIMVKAHPPGFANSQFTNTFGDAYSSIDALLGTGKVPFQIYNLRWSDTHSVSRRDFPAIVTEARKYAKLAAKYPNVGCGFSGMTEHQLKVTDATDLANLVLAVIPERCVYINNPWVGKGAFIKPNSRIWNEVHGADARPPNIGGKYVFNYDGSDCFDYNTETLKQRFKDAALFFFWTSQNNGRFNRNDATPRPKRRAWPTQNLLKAEAFLSTFQGDVRLPNSRYLVKPKSDQHTVPPESRALKPVFIFPISARRIELRAAGKKIIESEDSQPFADGRRRYYFGVYGFRITQIAGVSVLEVWAGNNKIGTVNPGFRQ